jgi:replicative DNA helicase
MVDLYRAPTADDAEAAVLSTMALLPSEFVPDAVVRLRLDDFRTTESRKAFQAIAALHSLGKPVNTFTIRDMLSGDDDGLLEHRLKELLTASPAIGLTFDSAVERVKRTAALRRIAGASYDALREVSENADPQLISSKLIAAMSGTATTGRESIGIYDAAVDVLTRAEERAIAGRSIGVTTGFDQLDDMTGGLPRKALTVLGAPTSHGKTSLALNLAWGAANTNSRTVLYSLEMSRDAIVTRLLSMEAGIPLGALRDVRLLDETQRAKLAVARESLRDFNSSVFLADTISTVRDLVSDARRRHARAPVDLIVVDYLQLLQGDADEQTRERTVNQLAWTLFELAKELGCAVLALSQVTPAAQTRTSGRLSVDDLRDCRAIGHHARAVLLMQRPWQNDKSNATLRPCQATLQIEKQSEGTTGDIRLHFDGKYQRFSESESCVTAGCWRGGVK